MTALTPVIDAAFGGTWQTPDVDLVWTELRDADDKSRLIATAGLKTTRGRATEAERFKPTEITGTLRNDDRGLDNRHTAGPNFGQLIAGVPLRLTATPDGYPTVVFARSYITGFPQQSDVSNNFGTVPIQSFGTLDKIARAKAPTSVFDLLVQADTPFLRWRCQESGGDVMVDSSGHGVNGDYTPGTTALPKVVMVYGEAGYIEFDGEHRGTLAFSSKVSPPAAPVVIECILRTDKIDPAFTKTSSAWVAFIVDDGKTNGNRQIVSVDRAGAPPDFQDIIAISRVPGSSRGHGVEIGFDDHVHHLVLRNTAPTSDLTVDGTTAAAGVVTGHNVPLTGGVNVGGLPDEIDTTLTVGGLAVGTFSWQGPLGEIAFYDHDLTDAQIAAHRAAISAPWDLDTVDERLARLAEFVGLPADRIDLEPCQTILGPASFQGFAQMLDYWRCLEDSEDGFIFEKADGTIRCLDRYWPYTATEAITAQITLDDTPGTEDFPYYAALLDNDDTLLVNVADGSRQGGVPVRPVRDEVSIGLYGEASISRTNLAVASDADVTSVLEHIVAVGATPKDRFPSVRIPMHKLTPAQQYQLLTLEMRERVELKRRPQNIGDQIVLDFVVEGVDHDIAGPNDWWVDLYLSPAPSITSFWKWGYSEWGVDTVWAY
jgi:hypothetical protein